MQQKTCTSGQISAPSTAKGEEGAGSKASGKEGQCNRPRRLEDRLQKMGGNGSQASAANTKPIASASTNVNIVNNVHNELNVWYTNSDQFLNKIDELKLRIYHADTKPSIIAITEVNPKNNRNPIIMSELKIDNFWNHCTTQMEEEFAFI